MIPESSSLAPPRLDYTKTTLPNGLDLILRRQEGVPLVAVNLWYHVGSKDEERHRRGLAHLFEHLMFEGSAHYPGDFFKPLQRFGATINGSTSTDRTNYFVDLPPAHLELALAMESDRMGHLLPALTAEKLQIQKDVVKNEYRQNYENRPYGRVWRLLAEAMYPPGHPYSWTTIGVMEDLDAATLEECSAFFRRYYVPGNASLAIVGAIDPEATAALAARYFGEIAGGSAAPPVAANLSPWSGERRVSLRDRVELDRLYLLWPTVPQFARDDAALALLGDVLGGGRTSRLYRSLVVERQIAQDVSAYQHGRELGGAFGVVATLRPGQDVAEARAVIDALIEQAARAGIADDECERARTRRLAAFVYALDSIGGFGGVADRLNAYNIYLGDPGRATSDFQRFRDVEAADLGRVAATYLHGQGRVTLDVLGRGPATPAVVPIDRSIRPTPAAPAAYRAPVPTVHRLACGLTVWVVPRPGLPIVACAAAFTGGASAHPSSRGGLAKLAAEMLPEGTRSFNNLELAQAAEDLGTNLSTSAGWDGSHVGMTCLTPHLDRSLGLVAELIRDPRFPEREWPRIRAQALTGLRSQKDSAEARAHRAFLRLVYPPEHPFAVTLDGTEATVGALELDELARFHAGRVRSDTGLVVLAGAFDVDRTLAMLDRLFGSEPFGAEEGTPPTWPEPLPAETRLVLAERQGSTQAVIKLGHVGIDRLDPDYWPLALWNQVLGGQFVSRLNTRIREEKGLTYGIRSGFDPRRRGGLFAISASLQADRIEEALRDVRHEMVALLGEHPPTLAEFDDAKRALIEGQARHFETPGALAGRFAGLHLYGLDPDEHARTPEKIAAVSCEQAVDAARRRLRPGDLAVVVVGEAATLLGPLQRLEWGPVATLAAEQP